ncbi:MAG: hypothetical protein ACFCAD_14720 [Pleurocapsa sp.]
MQIAALTIQRYRSSDGQIYVVTEPFFNSRISARDTTNYLFNGATFGKGRLVLEIIKSYADRYPQTSYSELDAKFPRSLQGNRKTISLLDEAFNIFNQKGHIRHYINPNEPIKLSDCEIAVINQWSIGNINSFINCARKHGYEISGVKN